MTDDILTQLGYVYEDAAAVVLDVEVTTLRNNRSRGIGPPYSKVGKTVLYPITGLKRYLEERTVTPTEQPTLIQQRRRRGSTRPAA